MYFSYYITAYYYFIVLFHYDFTIITIIFTVISDYIRVLHPFFQELADANLRPMRRAMTDKFPGVPAKLWDDQASPFNEAKPTYSAERRLFYALCLVLFLLFRSSVQDLAACSIDLGTAGQHTKILWDVSCHRINKKALLPITWAQFMAFSFVLYALYHYYSLLYLLFHKFRISIWVRIHCRKLVNQHIHHGGSTRIQSKSIRDSIINLQRAVSHEVRFRNWPIGIGLADVRQPSRTQFRFELITQSIHTRGNGCAPARRDQWFRYRHEPAK